MSQVDGFDLSALPTTHQAAIPESYLDLMGHMNVAWYTHLFSQATGGFFELFGMGRAYMEEYERGSFALEAHVRYLSEVHAGNRITIRSRAVARTQKRFHFLHFMTIDEGDVLAATCEFVGAHIDLTVRRMAPIPAEIAAGFDRLAAEHTELKWAPRLCGAMKP